MKKNNIMTVITVLISIVIIVISVGVVNAYSYYKKQNSISKITQTKLSNATDASFEKRFFDEGWEEYKLSGTECDEYPKDYARAYEDILKEVNITTYGRQKYNPQKGEFIFIDQFEAGQVKSYFKQNEKRIDIKMNYHMENGKKGTEKEGKKYIEEQLQEKNSRLHSMLNHTLDTLQKNKMIDKKQKVEFSSGNKFIHNKKIYIPFIEQSNYIVFIYDYQIEKYCGIKISFSK